MENKSIKKSTMSQLQALVEYMEANPDFARGRVVFGCSKMSVEEQWSTLSSNLNSRGPPIRTVSEWKKSWADLKSRTKKKIAENKRSLTETGGGLFRNNPLTELEQVVDRTLFLSKAAAPSGNVFGFSTRNSSITTSTTESIDGCFVALKGTPPRTSKSVAVVTPSRQRETSTNQVPSTQKQFVEVSATNHCHPPSQPPTQQQVDLRSPQNGFQQQQQKHKLDMSDEPSITSSSKKRKTVADEQLTLIRRQLKVGEQSAAQAKDQVDVMKTLAEATKVIAASAQRMADAAEQQVKTSAKIADTLELLAQHLMKK